MKITGLSLTNARALKDAEFEFNPGFNLIVGINGAGKSTALDSIRFCSSHLLNATGKMPFHPFGFSQEDINGTAPFAEAVLEFVFAGNSEPCSIVVREWREIVAEDDPENIERLRREIIETDRPRTRLRTHLRELQDTLPAADPVYFFPDRINVRKIAAKEPSAPLVVHYGTSRSYFRDRNERASASSADQAAFYDALGSSALNLRLLAEWLRAQNALSEERSASATLVKNVEQAIGRFLPGYSNLRTSSEDAGKVTIDRDGRTLSVRQLSDGERSVLALVVDLAKRLSQANPTLADPVRQAEAVVLIDEIDLHLHPQWQRKIVHNLEQTFPACQFIATTHSPQVIGEVSHDKIQIIDEEIVFSPSHSYGVDSSRVLEEVMDTRQRTKSADERIKLISRLISEKKLEDARTEVQQLATEIGGDDPEITRALTYLSFLERDQ